MRASQGWIFKFDRGTASPKERELFPDAFEIYHTHISLFPVSIKGQDYYLSYDIKDQSARYFLCPRVGSSRQIETALAEAEMLEGILTALPPRVNATTLFNRISALPEHMHSDAIQFIATKKFTGMYSDPASLKESLIAMNEAMGAPVQRHMAVHLMAHEMMVLDVVSRPKALSNMRKKYPEPWIDEARKLIAQRTKIAKPAAIKATAPSAYDFGL